MKKLYLSSYYQLKTIQCETFDTDIQLILDQVIDRDGAICVSRENLRIVIEAMNAQRYQTPQSDYLVALYSDIEVAIQERKIHNMAIQLGFECQIETSQHPKLKYWEAFDVDEMALSSEETVAGNIYVINTHGKPHELDGPFTQAIHNSYALDRIVIDACSSAVSTTKKEGNNSILSRVATVAFQANRPDSLEVVGYTYDFTTDETYTTARAIFAKSELLQQEKALKLITVGTVRENTLADRTKVVLTKMTTQERQFEKDCNDKLKAEITLRNALIEVCSKSAAHLFTLKTKIAMSSSAEGSEMDELAQEADPSILLLMNITDLPEHEKTQMMSSIKMANSRQLKILKNELKEHRKQYINKLDTDGLLIISKKAIRLFHDIDMSKSFKSSIDFLEISRLTLQHYRSQPSISFVPISPLARRCSTFFTGGETSSTPSPTSAFTRGMNDISSATRLTPPG